LGTALFMMGDPAGASDRFHEALRLSPQFALAHYSLGVLLETSGRQTEAIERFRAAVQHEPSYIEARLRLASVLRRSGRLSDALSQYEEIIRIDPRVADARLGQAMTLVRLGRYQAAVDQLSENLKSSGQPPVALALARLLAAAPDSRIRDGRRAMAVMQALSPEERSLDAGETMAMMFAEVGQFKEAVAWQRSALERAQKTGRADVARRLAENLQLYERGQPCRTPWSADEML
jgi:tetratricopeptide (TPR) repeat protein